MKFMFILHYYDTPYSSFSSFVFFKSVKWIKAIKFCNKTLHIVCVIPKYFTQALLFCVSAHYNLLHIRRKKQTEIEVIFIKKKKKKKKISDASLTRSGTEIHGILHFISLSLTHNIVAGVQFRTKGDQLYKPAQKL